MKYIIKFLQSHDNNNKKKFDFYNLAEHLQKARGTSVKNQLNCRCKEKISVFRVLIDLVMKKIFNLSRGIWIFKDFDNESILAFLSG